MCVCVCTRRENAELWKVVLGLNNLDHPGVHSQSRGVRSIIVHPRYNRAVVDYDISVVQLDSEVRNKHAEDFQSLVSGDETCCGRRSRRRRWSDPSVCRSWTSFLHPTPTATSPAGVTWATGVSTGHQASLGLVQFQFNLTAVRDK